MLVMPILNTGKDGTARIYNVEVRLKTATKVKENAILKGFEEADIIVNGSSFKNSIFNVKNLESNVVYRSGKRDFLITTRHNSSSDLYDLYSVELPPKKVSIGLDNLYGKVVIDMQKEIPDIKRGRYLSLKELGIEQYLTDERINNLRSIVNKANSEENLDYLLFSNNLGDLRSTIDFMKIFDFKIINEATVTEKQVRDLQSALKYTFGRDARDLEKYYKIAKDNKEMYRKLSILNQIFYNKPINLIRSREKIKVFVKKDNMVGRENERETS